ncbi:MAG: septum formation protein Maf [Bdellovibrionales bacterium]|nr:septum formation protein Maf [Bdellovibrionales bacterium]
MKQKEKLVLASASPRRKSLLEMMGLECNIVPSDIDESECERESAEFLSLELSRRKLEAVRSKIKSDVQRYSYLSADTVVSLDGEIFGKPDNFEHARAMLAKLSGKTHQVHTGFRLENVKGEFVEESVCTDVTFASLSSGDIDDYVRTKEPMDKAGAYGIQGIGGGYILRISGSYTNVVGLPVYEVLKAMKQIGVIVES